MIPSARRRRVAAALAAGTVVVGLGVHTLAPPGAVGDIAGDALYALLIYLLLVALAPRRTPWFVGALALVWCVVVELFQLTSLPAAWAAQVPPVRLVLGVGFDARDLLVYAVAIVAASAADALLGRAARRNPRHPSPGDAGS